VLANAAASSFHMLLTFTVALTAALGLRLPVRALFGAKVSYGVWAIVPVMLLASVLPAPVASHGTLPQLTRSALTAVAAQWIAAGHQTTLAVSTVLCVAWVIGAAAFGLVQLGRQRAFVRSLGSLEHIGRREWIAQTRSLSPAVVGALRPRIVLPADFLERYSAAERELVIAHERMHIRRLDHLTNLAVLLMRTVCWFHPLVHLAARCLHTDQELACDASVIAARPTCRLAYAQTLLRTHQIDLAAPVSCPWESETARSLNRRFIMLNTSLPTRARRLAGATVIALAALTAGGFTWAAQPQTAPMNSITTLAGVDLAGVQTLGDIVERCQRAANPPLVTIDGQTVAASNVNPKSVSISGIERIEVVPAGSAASAGTINVVLRK
jgi:bla regulator protein blaR1